MARIELIVDARSELSEGPLWDPVEGLLFWVSSKAAAGPSINRFDPHTRAARTWSVPADIGSMALRAGGGAPGIRQVIDRTVCFSRRGGTGRGVRRGGG